MNKIWRKLTTLNTGGNSKNETLIYYRIAVNGRYVTDYKLYDKDKAENEAIKLGGKVDRTRLAKWQLK